MKLPTRQIAQNRWHGILVALGLPPKYLNGKHQDCPLCGDGDDRFRWDNREGRGTYYCSHCGPGDGLQLALAWTGKPFAEVAAEIDRLAGNTEARKAPPKHDPNKTRQRLKRIGAELQPVGQLDPVGRYLRKRGIHRIPRDYLRFHPRMPFFDKNRRLLGHYPAMVAAFRRPNGQVETFHVTYLTPDGEKADLPVVRKVVGIQEGLDGCAIRLSEVERHIGIAEGLETAMSVTELYGIPCWSVYSANNMASFQPPQGVEEISIFADPDANFHGQDMATAGARQLYKQGYTVRLAPFIEIATDYNDLLLEARCQAQT